MKKTTKRLALTTQTIRALQTDELSHVQGGSLTSGGTSIIRPTGTSIINPSTIVQTGTSIISVSH